MAFHSSLLPPIAFHSHPNQYNPLHPVHSLSTHLHHTLSFHVLSNQPQRLDSLHHLSLSHNTSLLSSTHHALFLFRCHTPSSNHHSSLSSEYSISLSSSFHSTHSFPSLSSLHSHHTQPSFHHDPLSHTSLSLHSHTPTRQPTSHSHTPNTYHSYHANPHHTQQYSTPRHSPPSFLHTISLPSYSSPPPNTSLHSGNILSTQPRLPSSPQTVQSLFHRLNDPSSQPPHYHPSSQQFQSFFHSCTPIWYREHHPSQSPLFLLSFRSPSSLS